MKKSGTNEMYESFTYLSKKQARKLCHIFDKDAYLRIYFISVTYFRFTSLVFSLKHDSLIEMNVLNFRVILNVNLKSQKMNPRTGGLVWGQIYANEIHRLVWRE